MQVLGCSPSTWTRPCGKVSHPEPLVNKRRILTSLITALFTLVADELIHTRTGTWLLPQYLDKTSALWDSKRTQNQSAGISLMKRYNSPEETYKAMVGINDPYLFLGLADPSVVSSRRTSAKIFWSYYDKLSRNLFFFFQTRSTTNCGLRVISSLGLEEVVASGSKKVCLMSSLRSAGWPRVLKLPVSRMLSSSGRRNCQPL